MNNHTSVKTYLKSKETAYSIRADFIIALIPMVMWSIIRFKLHALALISSTLISALVLDFLIKSISNKKLSPPSLYSVYCSLVLSATYYADTTIPFALVSGAILSIFIYLLGGEKKCFIFTPVAARLFSSCILSAGLNQPNVVPFNNIIHGTIPNESPVQFLLGINATPIGTGAILFVSLGGIYLILRKAFDTKSSITYLMTSIGLSFIFPAIEARGVESIVYELVASEMLFVFFFALSDLPSNPTANIDRYLKGFICALITFIIKKTSYTTECFLVAVIATDMLMPIITMLRKSLNNIKERKNAEQI